MHTLPKDTCESLCTDINLIITSMVNIRQALKANCNAELEWPRLNRYLEKEIQKTKDELDKLIPAVLRTARPTFKDEPVDIIIGNN